MPKPWILPAAISTLALASPCYAQRGPAIDPLSSADASAATYYFCPAANAYYPYVASCPVPWQRRPATPADAQPPSAATAPAQTPSEPQQGSAPRVVAQFKNAAGWECREYEETVLVDGVRQLATRTACQDADGRRAISPSRAVIQESKN